MERSIRLGLGDVTPAYTENGEATQGNYMKRGTGMAGGKPHCLLGADYHLILQVPI